MDRQNMLDVMQPVRETTLEIDLHALIHNYMYLRSKIPSSTKFMGVVKAYAYGSDAAQIGKRLLDAGAEFLAVSYVHEGVALRRAGIASPILVFHPQGVHYKELIAHHLIPTLYSLRSLREFIEEATALNMEHYPVHLNLNTGMNRLGFNEDELEAVLQMIGGSTALQIEGIYSHLVASEDPMEKAFTQLQIERFKAGAERLIKALPSTPLLHLCNTSGILNYPEAHFDMVRAGIGLYGYGNSPEQDQYLIPAASLKAPITRIHQLKKGDTVGYNRKYKAEKDSRIAVLPLGYADGLYRVYGNARASVLIHGKLAPLVGNICMGMAMVEVTDIPCEEGDEALIFGAEHPAQKTAQQVGTISYELITGISQRVKRVIKA